MILTTAVTMITIASLLPKTDSSEDPSIQWRRPFRWILITFDLFINSLSVLMIYRGAWLDDSSPKYLKVIFRFKPEENSSANMKSSNNSISKTS
eukprot:CAMPEP_0184046614 /NCGR_PEP_ID=MMETSP0956-20121227/1673_1 /TAXON_ID=627963 /ORGANISM="Aplanochytrium sp, Strain PBS07" /LENGTH=93 /DNA_ID=CAMNT_0026338255 /DNA_START=850 /DNA_END=1127 /DNA_ORIENTATION=+